MPKIKEAASEFLAPLAGGRDGGLQEAAESWKQRGLSAVAAARLMRFVFTLKAASPGACR